jgi:alpha-tubulin suppressor-like RCC1 family protein
MEQPVSVSPRRSGIGRILRSVAVTLAALTLITCAEDPVGPATGSGRLRLVLVFGPYARVAPLALDRVRLLVERLDPQAETSDTLVDEGRGFEADATQLRIDDVTIRMPQAREDVLVTLQLLSGTTLLFAGSQTVTVVRGQRTPETAIPVSYQGPGANVAVLTLAPRDTVLSPSATVDYRLDAFDIQGAPVAQYYVAWSLTGGPAADARINAVGRLTAPAANDTFYVKVVAPNGVLDSTRVIVGAFTPPGVSAVPLAAGDDQSCQITGGGTYCWGANDLGQLGDGTTTDRLVPTPVAGGHTFVAVSLGVTHGCALTAQGQAFCWGDNSSGALGDGTTTSTTTPVAVSGGFALAQIAAANGFTCAVTLTGEGRCWGANFSGQLGDGTTTSTTTPVAVAGGHRFTRISAAGLFDSSLDHACALDGTGQAWCWGDNSEGQLGDGGFANSSTPVAVSGGLSFGDISVGRESSCAITTTGAGFCWGFNFGVQLTTPQPVAGGFTYTALDMGANHVCGRAATGWLCGGDNSAGQLGDGTTTDRPTPVAPAGGLSFTALAAGGQHTCGLTATGTFCWGNNSRGQLGSGDVNRAGQLTPTAVVGAPASVTLSAGDGQTAPVGGDVTIAPAVLVRDAQGTPVPGVEVLFAITGGGGTILGGATSEAQLSTAAGIATVSGWTLGPAAGANGLRATVSAAGVSGNPVSFTATGAAGPPPALTWTGAVSTDWSVAGNWSPAQVPGILDSVVIGAAGQQPSLSTTTTVGAVNIIAGGNLTINGQGISIARGLATGGTGVLTMTNDADAVAVGGNAVFNGGNELNLLSAGGISIVGSLTQLAGTSGDSYHPSGTHVTLLAGASPTVSFATPGLVPGTSQFQDVAWVGTGTLTLLTPAMALGTFVVNAGTTSTISSANGSRLTAADLVSVSALVLNNVPLTLSQATPGSLALDNVTFQNMPTAVSQLVVSHPGGTFAFSNLVFGTTPVAPNGFYLDVTDVTGPSDGSLVIDMVNPSPASGGAFLRVTNGAVVNWPPVAPINNWTGSASTDWSTAANWSLGVLPGTTDSVVIPAQANQPVLTAPVSVGAVTVSGGTLTLNGQTLTVARTFATTGSGTFTSNTAADLLVVAGNTLFAGGDETGLLTDGNLRIAGDFTQGTTANGFVASGSHTTFFNGTGAQAVTVPNGGPTSSRFQNLRVANAIGTVTLSGTTPEVVVNGVLAVANGATLTGTTAVTAANVSTSTGSTLSVFQLTVPAGSITVAGNYAVNQTILTGGGTVPAIPYNNLTLTGGTAYPLGANLTTAGTLTLQSDLTVGGHTVQTGAGLVVGGTGRLIMTNTADQVTVGGNAVFQGGDETGQLTAGVLSIGQNFTQAAGTGSPRTFVASGTHRTVLNALATTTVSFLTPGPATSHFQDLDINGTAPVDLASASGVTALGAIRVTAAANITGGGVAARSVRTVAGSNFSPGSLQLSSDTLVVAGGYAVGFTEFDGGTTLPTLPYQQLLINVPGTMTLAGNTTTGLLQVQGGSLVLGGRTITVNGDFFTQSTGTLTMNDPADLMTVTGGTSFYGGDETGKLTAGILRTSNQFLQDALTSPASFVASGTHTVEIVSQGGSGVVSFANPTVSHFQNLRVLYISGFTSEVVVNGDMEVNFNAADNFFTKRVTVGGSFTKAGIGFFGPTRLTLLGSASVTGGNMLADTLELASTTPVTYPDPGFSSAGTVFIAGDVTMPFGTAVASGDVEIQGSGILRMGNTGSGNFNILGNLRTLGNGRLEMTDPLTVVTVGGNASFAGGSELGLLTDGKLSVGGDFTQSAVTSTTSFAASGTHSTVFTSASARTIDFGSPGSASGGSHFQNLDLSGATGGVALTVNSIADGQLISSGTGRLNGGGSALTVRQLQVSGLIADNTSIILDEQGTGLVQQFDNVTFQNLPSVGALPLSVTGVGGAAAPRTITFNAVNFPTLATGAGNLYVKLTSSNGFGLTLRMLGSNQGIGALGGGPALSDPPNQTPVAGATILWQ